MEKIAKPSQADAPVFYPSKFVDAFALVIKPREVIRNNAYGKPEVLCSVIVFDSEESLMEHERPTRVIVDTIVTSGRIVRALVRAHEKDQVIAGYISQDKPTRQGTKPWIIKDLADDEQAKLVEVWEKVIA